MNARTLLLVVAAAALTAACGDLSEEDLIFKAAIPAKAQLELQPPGEASTANGTDSSTTLALDEKCPDGDLRCNVRNTAKGFNGLTFALLDLIDRISAQPPTTRKNGVRVWGPFYDLRTNTTGRFEISRNADGTSFAFCLHAVRGVIHRSEARDITCATDVDANTGLALLLSGTFAPSDLEGGARHGDGHMALRIDRIPDFAALHGHDIEIHFDNRPETGKRHVDLTINGVIGLDGTAIPPVTYLFDRSDDGSGDLSFDVFGDIAPLHPGLEEARIDALWQADQSGRAVARVSTSDGTGASLTEDQCWDKHVGSVYTHIVGNDGAGNGDDKTNGDESLCAFTSCTDFSALGSDAVDACNAAP